MAAFTIDDIIQAARDRTGNKKSTVQGEEFVPDEAITAGLRSAIIDLNALFGQSGARKENSFWTVPTPTLVTPGAPTLVAQTGTGNLPAGSYQYRIVATHDALTSAIGPEAVGPAVLVSTGQVVVSWSAIANADGYEIYGRTPSNEQMLVSVPADTLTWTDTGVAVPSSGIPAQSTSGTGFFMQDYDVNTFIGADVRKVEEVLRSGEYVSSSGLRPQTVDPRTGLPFSRASWIDQAYQQDVLDRLTAMARYRRHQEFGWELVNVNGSTMLRLMPPPHQPELVVVRYVSASDSMDTLPEESRVAAECAACVALLDSALNRVNSNPSGMSTDSARGWRAWLDAVEKQRDRYERMYRAEVGKRPRA